PEPSAGDAEPLRRHVRPRVPSVASVLDRLLAGVVGVRGDWARAVDVALARPDLIVVSTDGDRFSPTGWVVRAGAHALAALAGQAAAEAEMAADGAERAARFVEEARARAEGAVAEARDLSREADKADDQRRGLEATQRRVESELALVEQEWNEAARHRESLT